MLSETFGVTGYSQVSRVEKNIDTIIAEVLKIARSNIEQGEGFRFKIQTRRTDKGFKMRSYDISCAAGDAVLDNFEGTVVDVKNPDWTINVEIRDTAYIYGRVEKVV